MKTVVGIVFLCLLASACRPHIEVPCTGPDFCTLEFGGVCAAGPSGDTWCQYPDGTCPSGMRWSDVATGDGLSGQCVVVPDAAPIDAPPVDAPPTVTIGNLRDRGVVRSGFLVGTASDNRSVSLVEVSLDGGAFQPATGTTDWAFALPTGPNTWRDDSAHTVTARATDDANQQTTSSTLTVRKGVYNDINGDGYADVVAGADAYNNYTGRVYVFQR